MTRRRRFVLWDAAGRREAEARIPEPATDPERLLRWCAAFVPLIAGVRLTTSDPPKVVRSTSRMR